MMLTCNQSLDTIVDLLKTPTWRKICKTWFNLILLVLIFLNPRALSFCVQASAVPKRVKNCYILIDYVSNAEEMWTISLSICVSSSAVRWWDENSLLPTHCLATGHAFDTGRASYSEKGTTRYTYLYFLAFLFFLIVHTIPFIVTYNVP